MSWDKVETSTKISNNVELNSKFTKSKFSKGANKGNAPSASEVKNIIKQINKKEGES